VAGLRRVRGRRDGQPLPRDRQPGAHRGQGLGEQGDAVLYRRRGQRAQDRLVALSRRHLRRRELQRLDGRSARRRRQRSGDEAALVAASRWRKSLLPRA